MMRLFTAILVALVMAVSQSAIAAPITFTTFMSADQEFPPVPSPGTGFARVDFDPDTNFMRVQATFQDLVGPTTVAHIHAPPLVNDPVNRLFGVATTTPTFPGFPAGVTSGAYDNTLDMTLASSYNPAYIAAAGGTVDAARAAFLAALNDGNAYFNVHTEFRPGGEIRGFLQRVSEPPTHALVLGVLLVIGWIGSRRKLA